MFSVMKFYYMYVFPPSIIVCGIRIRYTLYFLLTFTAHMNEEVIFVKLFEGFIIFLFGIESLLH